MRPGTPELNPTHASVPQKKPAGARQGARGHVIALIGILLVAAALRIPGLPWCLLKTGRDQSGAPWPILYIHAYGENRSALYVYALLPFQWLGGLNVWTTRLPTAVGGVLTVLLLYWIAARLFDRLTGLLAAGLLALNPWHIQLARFGHEASITPLLVCLAVAALLWAGFPPATRGARASVWRGLLAGIVVGGCCYGYPAIRLFLPLLLIAGGLVNCRAWWAHVKTGRGGLAFAALLAGLGLTFGPLAYYHLLHPDVIARRAETLSAWDERAPLYARVATVGARYAAHFNPDLLSVHGQPPDMASLRGFGRFQFYTLLLLFVGFFVLLRNSGKSRAARIGLCWLLLYPAGDCLHGHMYQADDSSWHLAIHPLRSAPGLTGPILAAAVGAAALGRLLWRRRRTAAWTVFGLFGVAVVTLDARFLCYFFGEHNRHPAVQQSFQAALLEAGRWLRPRLAQADAVFVSSTGTNMPYAILLVALEYDPRQWFRDERVTHAVGYWDFYDRVGKLYFVSADYGPRPVLDRLRNNGRPDHVYFIGRPGETKSPRPPIHTIAAPDGAPALVIHEATF
jgi:4-amino-4-deoxy-L-arabinose transferase-like glycosyltransferase